MKLYAKLLAFSGLACLMVTYVPLAAQAANPIQIQQCFVTQPRAMSTRAGGTQIDYVNRGSHTANSITFTVGYRNAQQHFLRRVTDTGAFAPGAVIQHHFALFNDVTYAGHTTQFCQATTVRWSNGTTWTSS